MASSTLNNLSAKTPALTDIMYVVNTPFAAGDDGKATGQAICNAWGLARVLAKSGAAVSNTATTSEEVLATITPPAWSANSMLIIEGRSSNNNDADDKIIRIRINGISGTVLWSRTNTTGTGQNFRIVIMNRNATNSQIAAGSFVTDGNSNAIINATSAIETNTGAVTVVITGQKEASDDTNTLEYYSATWVQ